MVDIIDVITVGEVITILALERRQFPFLGWTDTTKSEIIGDDLFVTMENGQTVQISVKVYSTEENSNEV